MLKFYKYQGAGNDFVIIDNRQGKVVLNQKQIEKLCDRRFGIGADGLMLLNSSDKYDFEMVYFNSDGNESTMCGNGGRCIVKFAQNLGLVSDKTVFIAIDGEHDATVLPNGEVELGMKNVDSILTENHLFADTGSPHVVVKLNDIDNINIIEEAHRIRYSDEYKSEGTNVNFIEVQNDLIKIRTYERGVEDETLACGTGVTAAALIAFNQGWIVNENIKVQAKGGMLSVKFDFRNNGFESVYLTGPAEFVFEGEINV